MPRRKRTFWNDIQKTVWLAPTKSLLVFIVSVKIVLFIAHRGLMYRNAYYEASVRFANDLFVNSEICSNERLRANLGAEYADICQRAPINVQQWPALNALNAVIAQTHLCGDVGCVDMFERIVEIVTRSLAWTVAAFMIGVLLTILGLVYCFGSCGGLRKRRKTSVNYMDLEEQFEPLQITYIDSKKTI